MRAYLKNDYATIDDPEDLYTFIIEANHFLISGDSPTKSAYPRIIIKYRNNPRTDSEHFDYLRI